MKGGKGCNTDRSLWNFCQSHTKVFSPIYFICDISRVFWSNNTADNIYIMFE